jgi:putative peptide zinc metalloprotease protein
MTDAPNLWLRRIDLSESPDASDRYIVSVGQTPFARVSATVADILRHAQRDLPTVDVEGIAASMGLDAREVTRTLTTIGASPAVRATERRTRSRVQFRAPFAIQLTLFDPSALLGGVPALGRLTRSAWWWRIQFGLSAAGAVVLLFMAITPDSPLHCPMTVGQYIGVFVALFLTVFVHEVAHAMVLIGYGGRTHRLGVMLFYLAPAFFCDVSDAWRLPPAQRWRVVIAGILAQTTVAALAGLISLFLPSSVGVAFAVFAALCLIYGIVNLIPFVKLDGYIAIIGFLDSPNLRTHAIEAFHTALMRPSTWRGANRTDVRTGLILYGLACAVFPAVLVVSAGLAVNSYLASWGAFGAWATSAVFVVIAGLGLVVLWRMVRRSLTSAGSSILGLGVVVVTAAGCVAAAFLVPLPQQAVGGVITTGGDPVLAIANATSHVPEGTLVAVYASAVFPSQQIATAQVVGRARSCVVPLETIAPMVGSGLRADAQCYSITSSANVSGTTVAVLEGEGTPLASQLVTLVDRLITPN